MTQGSEEDRLQESLTILTDALERDAHAEVQEHLSAQHPAEVAALIEALPENDRDAVWEQLHPERHGEVLAEANDAVRASRMLQMQPAELAVVAADVDLDDAADILQDLPQPVIEEVLQAMDEQNRRRLESVLEYPEDTAGGLMNTDVLTVRADVTLETVLRYLRARKEIPEKTNRLMVVDRENTYLGMLRLAALLINDPATRVEALMESEIDPIGADTPEADVATLFEQRNLISAPVVDSAGRLLGRITIDDVVDVIRDQAEHSLMSLAGLDEEDDTFASVATTVRKRTLWLGVNLATALLASWVIGLFEATLEQVVALAILMPVVASMGGIAGSQTLTVVIRGLAVGQIGSRNARSLVNKECLVGLLNSLFWAIVLCTVAAVWFDDLRLGLIVATALFINLVVAALAGALIPLVLRRLKIDPALAGGVVLTTVTDVVGFVAFLGLGTVFLATWA